MGTDVFNVCPIDPDAHSLEHLVDLPVPPTAAPSGSRVCRTPVRVGGHVRPELERLQGIPRGRDADGDEPVSDLKEGA